MFVLCMRVLTMSRGWTTRVEIAPAVSPAMDSTAAGERPALFWEGIKANCVEKDIIYMAVGAWKGLGDEAWCLRGRPEILGRGFKHL